MTRPPSDPSDNSSTEPPTPDPSEGGEFSYVQRNVVLTAVSLLLLFVGVGVLGIFFEERLLDATSAIYDVLGLPGLLAILFVSDAVISPVPPDVVLIVLANSPAHAIWTYLIPAIGLMSAAAGHIVILALPRTPTINSITEECYFVILALPPRSLIN